MGKHVVKFYMTDVSRMGEMESWLTDMAAQGLHLVKLGWGTIFATFKKGEPADIHYRIDIDFHPDAPKKDKIALYEESGWEFVCKMGSWQQIYRSPEARNAPELHTDPAELAHSVAALQKRVQVYYTLSVVCFMLALCSQITSLFLPRTPVLHFIENASTNYFTNFVLFVWIMGYLVTSARGAKGLIRQLQEGRPINHRANWRRNGWVASYVVIMALGVVGIALPIGSLAGRGRELLPAVTEDVRILRLADIETDTGYIPRASEALENDVVLENRLQTKWSPLASVIIETDEQGKVPGRNWAEYDTVYAPSLTFKYYKLTLPFLGAALLDELAVNLREWNEERAKIAPPRPVETIQTDAADIMRLQYAPSGFFDIYAQKGSVVVYVRYSGEESAETVIRAVEAYLRRQ